MSSESMYARCSTFLDIFKTETNNSPVREIVIPRIQRDYVQGRDDPMVGMLRENFLQSLKDVIAIDGNTMNLDFVYGEIDDNGVLTPLDGQQRLTTLFLLHWYAARKESIPDSKTEFLSSFSYNTRYSAREFCKKLAKEYKPQINNMILSEDNKAPLSKDIKDQPWFIQSWDKDTTIHSMLVMLDAIHKQFREINNLWKRLDEDRAITFDFLPISDMGQSDELYIRMNSRGKSLTPYEIFKAELEKRARKIYDEDGDECLTGKTKTNDLMKKIDSKWTNLLWSYHTFGNQNEREVITDGKFLNYFRYICDVHYYRSEESSKQREELKNLNEIELLKQYLPENDKNLARKHIEELESFFDCWCGIKIDGKEYSPHEFLQSCMSHEPDAKDVVVNRKIVVSHKPIEIDIFHECLKNYGDNGKFPLGRFALLYAVILYLRNLQEKNDISRNAFARRLRCINNLIQNSSNDEWNRYVIKEDHMSVILQQVHDIMIKGDINKMENGFNDHQIQEEIDKKAFLTGNPDKAPLVFALEDNEWLHGQISIITVKDIDNNIVNDIDNVKYADEFESLFKCDLKLVDKALMAIGNYGQHESNGWRCQFASHSDRNSWDRLFHWVDWGSNKFKRANDNEFIKTSKILVDLLKLKSNDKSSTPEEFLKKIVKDFVDNCNCDGNQKYPWQYYYIKYPSFRPGCFGKFTYEHHPYLFYVLTRYSNFTATTAYMPFLKEAGTKNSHYSFKYGVQRLHYEDISIICQSDRYVCMYKDTEDKIDEIPIKQNDDGIDTVDRIVLLKKCLEYLEKNIKPKDDDTDKEGRIVLLKECLDDLKKQFNEEQEPQ